MTMVKICGITRPEDAQLAVREGADLIGMILWKESKRCISPNQGKEIVSATREIGAIPVAVFVDQDAEGIKQICSHIGVDTIQLHGKQAKESIKSLAQDFNCLFAVSVTSEGTVDAAEDLLDDAKALADYLLFDHARGGTGKPFCWDHFQPPQAHRWFLAGGVNPENVRDALKLAPTGIDVASGVERKGTVSKDPTLIKRLMEEVRKYDEAR